MEDGGGGASYMTYGSCHNSEMFSILNITLEGDKRLQMGGRGGSREGAQGAGACTPLLLFT